ncbi:hypothetical protein OROGR_024280 [Orobanche gracilis]
MYMHIYQCIARKHGVSRFFDMSLLPSSLCAPVFMEA